MGAGYVNLPSYEFVPRYLTTGAGPFNLIVFLALSFDVIRQLNLQSWYFVNHHYSDISPTILLGGTAFSRHTCEILDPICKAAGGLLIQPRNFGVEDNLLSKTPRPGDTARRVQLAFQNATTDGHGL